MNNCSIDGCMKPHTPGTLFCTAHYRKDWRRRNPRTRPLGYYSWINMKSRCYSVKDIKYYRYGGRGISVCDRWRYSFKTFIADMGVPPLGTTLDRINGNGNYEPNNCRWANIYQQNANRSNSNKIVGVSYINPKKKYIAYIAVNRKHISLGTFANYEDAVAARRAAEKKYNINLI